MEPNTAPADAAPAVLPPPPRGSGKIEVDPSVIGTVVNSLAYALRKGAYNDVPVQQLNILTGTIIHLEQLLPQQGG